MGSRSSHCTYGQRTAVSAAATVSAPIRASPPRRNKRFSHNEATTPPSDDRVSYSTLLDCVNPGYRTVFLKEWNRLPTHVREIAFGLNDPGWMPAVITGLGDILAEFPDVFQVFNRLWLLLLLEIPGPLNSSTVTRRQCRINPATATKVGAVLEQFLAAALFRHYTPPWASPVVFIPNTSGVIRITINYKKLNKLSILD